MRVPLRMTAVVCTLTLLSGCGLFDPASDEEQATGSEETGEAVYPEGPFVKEGLFGGLEFEARVAIHHVERWEDRSVLRFTANALDETEESYTLTSTAFARSMLGNNYAFELVDTVGGVHYSPMLNSEEQSIGSPMPTAWVPGADYEIELHYPPLPEDLERVSVLTSSTAGEFTGIPVVDGEPPEDPPSDSSNHADIEPGDTVRMELRDDEVDGDPDQWVDDLHAITEESDRTRADGSGERTVGLHADVLFEFDEAELTEEAGEVLSEIAEETRDNADPDEPPISVVGHTDGQGEDSYNMTLSEERAEAVQAFLSEELGSGYEFETEGRGAQEPVADESGGDVEAAQEANRRVEISYRLLREEERGGQEGGGEGQGSEPESAAPAPPAPFREDDGEVVDSGSGTFLNGNAEYGIDVYPMYRDGAYLVGVFEFENTGASGSVPPILDPLAGEYRGGSFTRFSVTAEGSEEVLRAVRIGDLEPSIGDEEEGTYLSARYFRALPSQDEETKRMFAYFPAPAGEVESVVLDADPFGSFTVPVE